MKAYRFTFVLFALMLVNVVSAQRNSTATVVAQSRDVSDNLDLQAVASVFGDSNDLEDFEKRLNDPSSQISNLDLNQDGYVDYLRIIEVAEGDDRVVVIQAVLGQDQFQDVATIEIEKQRSSSSSVNIQIVGNPYIYGPNYIYEPYYYRTPVFFDYFWLSSYRPYYSPWYYGYYPTYYSYWAPMPYYRYNRHIYSHINTRNRYVYTDTRRISRADRMYSGVSRNSIERQNPNRSFSSRNNNLTNRYALDKGRSSSRVSNTSNDRINLSTDRSSSVGRNNSATSTRSTSTVSDRAVGTNNSSVRSSGTRVRSDFNANRSVNSDATRLSVPSSTSRVNSSAVRSNTTTRNAGSSVNTNNRIERSSRSNSSSNSSSGRSSNSGSFSRSSNSGSFSRSSSPAPSRSMGTSSSRGSSGSSGRSSGR